MLGREILRCYVDTRKYPERPWNSTSLRSSFLVGAAVGVVVMATPAKLGSAEYVEVAAVAAALSVMAQRLSRRVL